MYTLRSNLGLGHQLFHSYELVLTRTSLVNCLKKAPEHLILNQSLTMYYYRSSIKTGLLYIATLTQIILNNQGASPYCEHRKRMVIYL